MYGNVALPQKYQSRCLGMLVDKHMNLIVSEEHAVQSYMAAKQRIKKFVREHGLRNRLWLSKNRHLCSLRRFLGVKSTVTKWPGLREYDQAFALR
eukprot:1144968-Pelagomonas_calceolata.AAC.1